MDEARLSRHGLAEGDSAAFERVYGLYGPAMYRCALRMLGSTADAEDTVQDAFADLVRGRASFAAAGDLKAYAFAVLRNAAMRLARRRSPAMSLDPVSLDGLSRSEPARASYGDASDMLWRLVGGLPARQRDVIVLKVQGELTFAQVADVCRISPHTAASRYRRGLAKLKRAMTRHQDGLR